MHPRRPSWQMRLWLALQRRGLVSHTSTLRDRLRALSILKHWSSARRALQSPWHSFWTILCKGKAASHRLNLGEPLTITLSPVAVEMLLKVWGHFPLLRVLPAERRFLWQVGENIVLDTEADGADLFLLYEVFVKKTYGSAYHGLKVIDIGAHRGETALFFLSHGAEKVACVEPYLPFVEKIKERLAANNLTEKAVVVPAAIGAIGGSGAFNYRPEAPECSSMGEGNEDVRIITFGDLLRQLQWEQVDVLKSDCEGGEYDLLAGASDDELRRVKVWVMEFHRGATPILERLKPLGYQIDYEEWPDGTGFLIARLPGAQVP